MRVVSSTTRTLVVALLAFITGLGVLSAQTTTTEKRGTMSLIEGRRYVVAFPQVWASPTEKPMPVPMMLLISSKSKAKVRITTPADPSRNNNPGINREVTLKPNEVAKIPIPIGYMNEESETRKGHGIMVTSDKPISVSTFQAWQGNGEMARHLPVEAWGKNYFTMNFYQDRYGTEGAGYKNRPGQILVIADKDNTVVTYSPTVTTEGGPDAVSTPKGSTQTVTLERGETFLIKAKIDPNGTKEWSTDLSGTYIKASRPVSVVSGHTKVAIMRYPDVLPPTGAFAAEAHFVRNNVHDAMLPVEMAGTEFVTVPCQYTPTRVVGMASQEFGIDDDKGDVIRIVALEDNTLVQSMQVTGAGLQNERTLRKGESFLATSVEVPKFWKTSKPALVGHYGKSYAKILPPLMGRSDDGKVDLPQGHPTVESGMPMLQYVPSVDRWVNYGVFYAPDGMDNFMNIVCRADEVGKIKFDGRALSSAFSPRLLPGTPFAYVRTNISTGDHTIESDAPSVKWAAWNYGSLDGLQQGRAYGTPIAIDLSIACDDSLSVKEQIVCGDVDAQGKILPENTTCGSIFAVYADVLDNYELIVDENFNSGDPTVRFQVKVLDKTKDATATVLVVTRSGKFVEKTYTYIADKLAFDPKAIDFGVLPYNTPSCKEITFTNMNANAPLNVKEIKAKYFPGTYTFNPTSFTLAPGASQKVQVCAMITSPELKLDTVLVSLDCFDMPATELRVRGAEPKVNVGDRNWGTLPASSPGVRQPVVITNASNVDVIIKGYDKTYLDGVNHGGNFFAPIGLEDDKMPITIKGGERYTFTVMYSPKGQADVAHRVDVPFYTNAKEYDTIAVLEGMGVANAPYTNPLTWNERVIDNVVTAKGISQYETKLVFGNSGNQPLTFKQPVITGADAAAFKIVDNGNVGSFPTQLAAGPNNAGERYITVAFVPNELPNRAAERNDYVAAVLFETESGASVSAELTATAWQPQVKGEDHDFGLFQLADAPKKYMLQIVNEHPDGTTNPTTGDAKGTHSVTITDIQLLDNAQGFTIDPTWQRPSVANPVVLQAGTDVWEVPVIFTPSRPGSFTVKYEITSDATYKRQYTLLARVETQGTFIVTNQDFEHWIYNSTEKTVTVRNESAADMTIEIGDITGPDALNYVVTNPLTNTMTVPAGGSRDVTVRFTPNYVTRIKAGQNLAGRLPERAQAFTAAIDFKDITNPSGASETKTSQLVGNGIYLETTDFIGRDYKTIPGKSVDVAVELKALPEDIAPSDLTQVRIRISYDNTLVRPRTGMNDVIRTGLQMDGWDILKLDQVSANMIEIDLKDKRAVKTPLRDNGTPLFKLTFDAFLAKGADPNNLFTSELPIQMYWNDHESENIERKEYVVFNNEPGKIVVDPQCAKGLRLVGITNTAFGVKGSYPNPASSTTVINYSIGLSGHTTIALYNNMGERVLDIVDTDLQMGQYELTVDLSLLPSGTYYYQVISGPYTSAPQVLNVVR